MCFLGSSGVDGRRTIHWSLNTPLTSRACQDEPSHMRGQVLDFQVVSGLVVLPGLAASNLCRENPITAQSQGTRNVESSLRLVSISWHKVTQSHSETTNQIHWFKLPSASLK